MSAVLDGQVLEPLVLEPRVAPPTVRHNRRSSVDMLYIERGGGKNRPPINPPLISYIGGVINEI